MAEPDSTMPTQQSAEAFAGTRGSAEMRAYLEIAIEHMDRANKQPYWNFDAHNNIERAMIFVAKAIKLIPPNNERSEPPHT